MATVARTAARVDRKVKLPALSSPAIRQAVPSLDDDQAERYREAHFEVILTHRQRLTLVLALERLEEDMDFGSNLDRLESDIEDFGIEQFRIPGERHGGLLDAYEVHEWLRRLKA